MNATQSQDDLTAATKKFVREVRKTLQGHHQKHAAFRSWQYRLGSGDRLPRGPFFKGKRPGRPIIVFDEYHQMFPTRAYQQSRFAARGASENLAQDPSGDPKLGLAGAATQPNPS